MLLAQIAGLVLALLTGLILGLIGGGGSILTLPILVYVVGIDPETATAYSLFIVGSTAMVGSARFIKRNQVNFRAAITFGVPTIASVYITRLFIMPAIPETIFELNGYELTKDMAIMLFFGVVMLLAAFTMIRNSRKTGRSLTDWKARPYNIPVIILEGIVVGVVTGLIGAGGGFLIVPALVLLAGLPMKTAIGTSLFIITAKSLIGFIGDLGTSLIIDWAFLLGFSAVAIAGVIIGTWFSKSIRGHHLKLGFGWFVLLMSLIILVMEFS